MELALQLTFNLLLTLFVKLSIVSFFFKNAFVVMIKRVILLTCQILHKNFYFGQFDKKNYRILQERAGD